MNQWKTTAGLSVVAVIAIGIAPTLHAKLSPNLPTSGPAHLIQRHHTPSVDVPVPVNPEAQKPATGSLKIDMKLDQTAVFSGESNERFVVITAQAPDAVDGQTTSRAIDLSVVMDSSRSMGMAGKMDYARRAARHLVSMMDTTDTFSLVTFNDRATVVVPATAVTDPWSLHQAIDGVYERGGTNLFAGLSAGGDEVQRTLSEKVGRVVVLSDGNANVGQLDPNAFIRKAAEMNQMGISVSAVGLGVDYNEDVLASIADAGGGMYAFVDDPADLEAVFAEEVNRTGWVVARNLSFDIHLGNDVELVEVIGWTTMATETGFSLNMGDMYAGQIRKVVARVRVKGSAPGSLQVADLNAHYDDLITDTRAAAFATSIATSTNRPEEVAASIVVETRSTATEAQSGWYLDQAARAYEKGDLGRALGLLSDAEEYLGEQASGVDDEMLEAAESEIRAASSSFRAYRPDSYEGKRSVKQTKEVYRDIAR